MTPKLRIALLVVALLATGAYFAIKGAKRGTDGPTRDDPVRTEEARKLWHRGLLELDQHKFPEAHATFGEVAKILPRAPDAWVNLGIAAMNGVTPALFASAEAAFRRALSLDPANLHAHHCFGVLLKHLGRGPEAEPHFVAVLEKDPHDPTAHYYFATLLQQRGDTKAAEKHLRLALEYEPHLSSALHKLFLLKLRAGAKGEADPFREAFMEFEKTGTGDKAGIVYTEMGRYGEAVVDFPGRRNPPNPSSFSLRFEKASTNRRDGPRELMPRLAIKGRGGLGAEGERIETALGPGMAIADIDLDGDLDVYVADIEGSGALYRNDSGRFQDVASSLLPNGPWRSISGTFGDIDNDGDPDLYICCAGDNRLLRNDNGKFIDITEATGTKGAGGISTQAAIADFDSDGDLDIYVANVTSDPGSSGPAWNQLFNNNRDCTFTDIAERCGVRGKGNGTTCVLSGDLDLDHDQDIVLFGPGGIAHVYRNDRIWRFKDCSPLESLKERDQPISSGLIADLDADGRPELLEWGIGASIRAFDIERDLRLHEMDWAEFKGLGIPRAAVAMDVDNDGKRDVLFVPNSGDASLIFGGKDRPSVRFDLKESGLELAYLRTLLAADLDLDGAVDLIASESPGGFVWARNVSEPMGNWLAITLKGVREEGKMRTNTGGVGAVVSVTSGTETQSQELATTSGYLGGASPVLHFGLGASKEADYVRVTWPDDVIQGESFLSTGTQKTITQVYRKGSSCPLLFAYDGEGFAFVTDFLGTGGLGFFLSPGVYAPPDPTENVAIPVLIPKGGVYQLRVHEPMEEIVYLDLLKLTVVDAPKGFLVVPDERLAVEGPVPSGRPLVFDPERCIRPIGVSTREGEADPSLLWNVDRQYQPGVQPDRRFLGYAAPQEIVLDFGPAFARLSRTKPLFLVLDGWVEYPYAHVNFAAGQAGLALSGLSLEIETAPGSFTKVHSDFGYPAGMPRTMTLDISAVPRDGTGRIRLKTNMELFVDRVFVGSDEGASECVVHDLEPQSATLRQTGYPREYSPDGKEPLLYDYALMDPAIDFKTMSGDYTRFGDVRELLLKADDLYVISGRAEEVALEFLEPGPVPEGRQRSFILQTVGWCKDMDLYTAHPHTVEPLPFLQMSGYPYPPSETYPRSQAHESYRATFNTRRLKGERGSR